MAAIYPGPKRPAPAYKEPQLSRADFDRTETFRKGGVAFRLRREVEAMIYAQSHTSIPIPSVLEVHLEDKGEISWILMERLPGQQLGECWPTMSEGAGQKQSASLRSTCNSCAVCIQPPLGGLDLVLGDRHTITG